jgi:hypothetical protein
VRLKALPLSIRIVRELHEKLMTGVRGDRSTPGVLRRLQNWIGPPDSTLAQATHMRPPRDEMLNDLEWRAREGYRIEHRTPPTQPARHESVHHRAHGGGTTCSRLQHCGSSTSASCSTADREAGRRGAPRFMYYAQVLLDILEQPSRLHPV